MEEQTVIILGTGSFNTDNDGVHSKGYGSRVSDITVGNINLTSLQNNLNHVIKGLDDVFQALEPNLGGMQLEEMTLKLEISAKGEIGLVGKVEAGASGGITLKYKRIGNE